MKKIALLGVGALILVLSGCSSMSGGMSGGDMAMGSGNATEAKSAIAAAESSLKKARSMNGEWRDSKKKMVKKAKAAASKGDFKKAIKLANMAKFQGDMGLEQAKDQANAGPWLF